MTSSQFSAIVDSQPINILTVTDKSGNINKVRFYPARNYQSEVDTVMSIDPDRMLALLSDEKNIVVVKFYEVGKVMPPISYFLEK